MGRKKKIVLTTEHIQLISNIKFEKFVFDDKEGYVHLKNLINDLRLSEKEEYDKMNQQILNEIYNYNPHSHYGWGCDQWSLFGGTYVLEDIALILGCFDKAIPYSENLATGRRFPEELEEKMYKLYDDIVSNFDDIMTIVFTFVNKGGLQPGVYMYNDFKWEILSK